MGQVSQRLKGPPTRRQMDILNFVRTTVSTRGFSPSIREIGDAVGLSSSSTVHSHLRSLQVQGYINRQASTPRGIELCTPVEMRLPEDVRDVLEGWLSLGSDGHPIASLTAATEALLARGRVVA